MANNVLPPFLSNLWRMIEDPNTNHIISWYEGRFDAFCVKDIKAFEQHVLLVYFKHNKFQSFIRQLNMYDFSKIRDAHWATWRHVLLDRRDESKLARIRRKNAADAEYKYHNTGAKLETQRMLMEHESRIEVLESELVHARGVQATTHNQLKNMENKQKNLEKKFNLMVENLRRLYGSSRNTITKSEPRPGEVPMIEFNKSPQPTTNLNFNTLHGHGGNPAMKGFDESIKIEIPVVGDRNPFRSEPMALLDSGAGGNGGRSSPQPSHMLMSDVSGRASPRSMMTPSSPIKPHHRSALSGRYSPSPGSGGNGVGPHSPTWGSASSPSDDLFLGRLGSMDGAMTPPADDDLFSLRAPQLLSQTSTGSTFSMSAPLALSGPTMSDSNSDVMMMTDDLPDLPGPMRSSPGSPTITLELEPSSSPEVPPPSKKRATLTNNINTSSSMRSSMSRSRSPSPSLRSFAATSNSSNMPSLSLSRSRGGNGSSSSLRAMALVSPKIRSATPSPERELPPFDLPAASIFSSSPIKKEPMSDASVSSTSSPALSTSSTPTVGPAPQRLNVSTPTNGIPPPPPQPKSTPTDAPLPPSPATTSVSTSATASVLPTPTPLPLIPQATPSVSSGIPPPPSRPSPFGVASTPAPPNPAASGIPPPPARTSLAQPPTTLGTGSTFGNQRFSSFPQVNNSGIPPPPMRGTPGAWGMPPTQPVPPMHSSFPPQIASVPAHNTRSHVSRSSTSSSSRGERVPFRASVPVSADARNEVAGSWSSLSKHMETEELSKQFSSISISTTEDGPNARKAEELAADLFRQLAQIYRARGLGKIKAEDFRGFGCYFTKVPPGQQAIGHPNTRSHSSLGGGSGVGGGSSASNLWGGSGANRYSSTFGAGGVGGSGANSSLGLTHAHSNEPWGMLLYGLNEVGVTA